MDVFEALLIAIVAGLGGGAMALLIYRTKTDRTAAGRDLSVPSETSTELVAESGGVLELPGAQADYEVFAIADPRDPSKEMWVEMIPEGMGQLVGKTPPVDRDRSRKYGFACDAVAGAIPSGWEAMQQGKVLRAVGPPNVLKGLANGSLELVTKEGGEKIATVRNVATGMFSGTLEIEKVGMLTPSNVVMGGMQLMAAVSGQYFMVRIFAELEALSNVLEAVRKRLSDQNKAWAITAARTVDSICTKLQAGVALSDSDRAQLAHVELLAHKAMEESWLTVEPSGEGWLDGFNARGPRNRSASSQAIHNVVRILPPAAVTAEVIERRRARKAREQHHDAVKEATVELDEVAVFAFAAATLARINLIKIGLERQGDPVRIEIMVNEYETERAKILSRVQTLADRQQQIAAVNEDSIDERFGGRVFKRTSETKESRALLVEKMKPLLKVVADPDRLMPPAPSEDPSATVIEMRRNEVGELEVYEAILQAA
jgi:hypothetical protein